jgi:hypothetical protein
MAPLLRNTKHTSMADIPTCFIGIITFLDGTFMMMVRNFEVMLGHAPKYFVNNTVVLFNVVYL